MYSVFLADFSRVKAAIRGVWLKVWNSVHIFGISDKVMTNRVDRLIFRNEDKKSQEFIHFLKTSKNKKLKELLENCQKHEWKNWLFEVEIRTGGQVNFNALHVAIVMQNMDVIDHLLDKEDRLLQSAAQRALRSERRSQKWERERERRSLKKMGARARAALWKKAERRERRSFSLFALFNSVTSSRTYQKLPIQ